jgi:Neocarzinostatin family
MRRWKQKARLGVVAAASFVLLVLVLPQVATGIGLGGLASRLTASAGCGSSGSSGSGSGSAVFGSGGSGSGSGSSTCGPLTLSAAPSTNLFDGEIISVNGSGFPPNSQIGMTECKTGDGLEGCDISSALIFQSDGSGSFSTQFTVSKVFEVSNKLGTTDKNFDCAPSRCFLGAADLQNYDFAATTPLEFNPRSPLALRATVSPTGTVNTHTGIAVISGTVTCTEPTEVSVYIQLQQTYKRFNFTSQGQTSVSCFRHTAWSVPVPPGFGLFGVGTSNVQAEISGEVGNSYRNINQTRNVELQTVKK